MKKNVASQVIGVQGVSASDGSAFTGTVTVYVTGDGGTQALGGTASGVCTHEGNGAHTYVPTQAETNYDHVMFTFTGTGMVPATVQVYTQFPQTGDNFARLGAPAGASVSADVAAVKAVLPAALVSGRIDASVGAMAANVLTATAIAADAITAAKIADGAIDAATFAAGAIDASAIATDAIGALELAAGAASEIATAVRTELTTELGRIDVATSTRASQTSVDTVDDFLDTEIADIQARLPAALVSGRMDASVGAVATGAITRAGLAADTGLQSARSNTAQAGASTTITLDASASATDDYYNGSVVYLTGGTGVGQARFITDYVGSTKVATVAAWATNPDATSTFAILPLDSVAAIVWANSARTLTALDEDSTTLDLDATIRAAVGLASANLDTQIAAVQADTDDIQTRIPAALVGGRIDANVGAISGDATAADNLEAAADGTGYNLGGGSVVAASVTGAVGSVTGAVGSVTGAVGSVTGNVGGNVTGSVGSVATGGITRASFAADTGLQTVRSNTAQAGGATTITLDASASATDDIYNNHIVYLTGGTGAGQARFITDYNGTTKVATVSTWTTNPDNTSTFAILPFDAIPGASAPTAAQVADEVQTRTIAAVTVVNGLAANVITAAATHSDFTTEIQTGLATAAALSTVSGKIDTVDDFLDTEIAAIKAKTDNLPDAPAATGDIPTATQNADALLNRDMSAVSDTNSRSPLNALRFIRNKWAISGTTLSVKKEDDTTEAWNATVSTSAGADPVVGNDPS